MTNREPYREAHVISAGGIKRAFADRQISAWLSAQIEKAECESADPISNPSANEGLDV